MRVVAFGVLLVGFLPPALRPAFLRSHGKQSVERSSRACRTGKSSFACHSGGSS